jgi:methionyl-tRNA synthetase
MTGIGYAQDKNGDATFQKYWRNSPPESELVHMVGKDILRFHAIYWPAFIMAAYPDQPEMLPTTIFAHGWIYYEQDKMSKSKGNVVYPEPIATGDGFVVENHNFAHLKNLVGNDALRYYLLREAPFGQDTSFSYDALVQRYNSDLANDLGNLANRTITMINRYFGGTIHAPEATIGQQSSPSVVNDVAVVRFPTLNAQQGFRYLANQSRFSEALQEAWKVLAVANKFLVDTEPWKCAPGDARLPTILYGAAEALRILSVDLYSVLPESASRLWNQLGCAHSLGKIEDQRIEDLQWGALRPGTRVGKPEPIFPRLDKPKTLAKLEELAEADRERDRSKGAVVSVPSQEPSAVSGQPSAAAPDRTPNPESRAPEPAQSSIDNRQSPITGAPSPGESASIPAKITINDFAKIDLRAGTILSAEAIPGAKKLLKLQVDIGTEVRQVCAGIAEFYRPEELIGMKIVLVANLEPRKLRGIESNGMVVAASIGPEGKPVLATFKEDVPNGAKLK